ncbi:MAG: ankyrin repeat domain-containing protein, partial [Candidatus Cardinium sp.]|nr:ankyrin repeat domain-containing protein [Candidatus Cardinium sp.]
NKTNQDGYTPLHIAAQCGHESIVTYLLNRGADINKENKKGKTPLSLAAEAGHIATAKKLMIQKAHLRNRSTWGHGFVLQFAAYEGKLKQVQALL